MKELILAVLGLITLVNNVNADSPTDKGVYSLSGSISYTRPDDDERIISATPSFMYFVSQNIAMGASIIYQGHKTTGEETNTYGIGPIVRFYFGGETIYPFVSVKYTYTSNTSEIGSYIFRTDGNDLSLSLGIDNFLSKNVALEPIVSYRFNSGNTPYGGTANVRKEYLFIGVGINVFIY